MSKFLTELKVCELGDCAWQLIEPLIYQSDLLNTVVNVPTGFKTDFASVPRVPILFTLWGAREHREAVLHDYLYCSDSVPSVTRQEADGVFYEAAKVRGKKWWIRWPMWAGVRIGGGGLFHKRTVKDHMQSA